MENITVKTISFGSYTECWVDTIRVKVSEGIGIHLIGMDVTSTKECLLRVITAIQSCGYRLPSKKIVIEVPLTKFTTMYDMPIAMGILFATGQLSQVGEEDIIYVGELGLGGATVYVHGARNMVHQAHNREGRTRICLPLLSAIEVVDMVNDDIYTMPRIGNMVPIWDSAYFRSIVETKYNHNIKV